MKVWKREREMGEGGREGGREGEKERRKKGRGEIGSE